MRLGFIGVPNGSCLDETSLNCCVRRDCYALAQALDRLPDQITQTALMVEAPFRMRRCGMGLKQHQGDALPEIDRTLLQNIAKARCWHTAYEMALSVFAEQITTKSEICYP